LDILIDYNLAGAHIYDALEKSFDLAGAGATNNSLPLGVEAIFLLSDGEPSAGKISNSQAIIDKIEELNPNNKLVINTIGLGKDKDEKFMKELAKTNTGVYI
jgi:hypothetical protein